MNQHPKNPARVKSHVTCCYCDKTYRREDTIPTDKVKHGRICLVCDHLVRTDPLYALDTPEVPPTRKCVDCGKPTNDYRCKSCREAKLGKDYDDYTPDVADLSGIGSTPVCFA